MLVVVEGQDANRVYSPTLLYIRWVGNCRSRLTFRPSFHHDEEGDPYPNPDFCHHTRKYMQIIQIVPSLSTVIAVVKGVKILRSNTIEKRGVRSESNTGSMSTVTKTWRAFMPPWMARLHPSTSSSDLALEATQTRGGF